MRARRLSASIVLSGVLIAGVPVAGLPVPGLPGEAARALAGADTERTEPSERAEVSRKNRERWSELGREEKKRLRRLYRSLPAGKREKVLRKLRAMSPEERRRAIRRARDRLEKSPEEHPEEHHVKRIRRRLLRQAIRRLSPPERRRLEQLSPEARRRFLMERVREQRRKLLEDLDPAVRALVRDLHPVDQARFLRRHLTVRAARRTFTGSDEVERLRKLDRRRVVSALLGRPRGGPSPQAAAKDRPGFLAEETWRRWLALEPYERPLVLRLVLSTRKRPWPPELPHPAMFSGQGRPRGPDGGTRPRRPRPGTEEAGRRERNAPGGAAPPGPPGPRRSSSDRRSDESSDSPPDQK